MNLLHLTLPTPQENLACDEALLEAVELGELDETLRFWESKHYFVVMGYGGKTHEETHTKQCQKDHIPILRRVSGGGTVLQGPGCLNFSLVLKMTKSELKNVTKANEYIMKHHNLSLGNLLGDKIEVQGHTDLTLGNLKFSGNAQRRKQHSLLFHGTFLYNFDLKKIETYLKLPPRQPCYREKREHKDFVTNLNLEPDAIKNAILKTWGADQILEEYPRELTQKLIREKYSQDSWNFKF